MKPTATHSDLFGGSGRVEVVDVLAGRPAGNLQQLLRCTLDPGGSVGLHKQEQLDAVFYCLQGQGTARLNGESRPFGPDDVVHLPRDATLSLRNDSNSEPLRYVIVKTPAEGA